MRALLPARLVFITGILVLLVRALVGPLAAQTPQESQMITEQAIILRCARISDAGRSALRDIISRVS
jgi:hypothetical protein